MAVPFGFSIGDFIAGINLVFHVYDALRESGGAASDYREHIAWLQQLVTVLEALKNSTPDDVAQMARECEAPLVEFRNKIRLKYNDTLGEGSRLSPGKVLRSLQWTFFKSASKDAGKLRTAIGPQLQAITLRLGLQTRLVLYRPQWGSNC